jgi:hypothetical protein
VSSNDRRSFGLNNTGAGAYRDISTNAAGSSSSVVTAGGTSSTSARTHRWRKTATTTQLFLDGSGADLGGGAGVAVTQNPGTSNPDTVVIGGIASSAGIVSMFAGQASVVMIAAGILTDEQCDELEAYL